MDHADAIAQLAADGWCVIPGVLTDAEADDVRARLWRAADESERRGTPVRNIGIDPNEHNVRVFGLIELDAVFRELIAHPLAVELVTSLIGPQFLISNFTANIAMPGARAMKLHSDQGIVAPAPWHAPWSINVIWCLNDVRAENGATRFVPYSHLWTSAADLPANAESRLVPFEAPKGAIIAMDGRVWHTSGDNVTADEERALLFGYYSRDFIRPQTNWNAALSQATIADLSPQLHHWLGLGPQANIGLAAPLLIPR